jgi:undecaprenyl phosphate-alpha-L-ara4N flippase subunit ArnE
MRYALLIGFAALMASGQMLFKVAADAGADRPMPQALLNGWLLAAVILYGAATLLWVYILRSTPLSAAYPFAALSFVLVPVGAWALLGEALSWRYGLGMLLIICGILLTTR